MEFNHNSNELKPLTEAYISLGSAYSNAGRIRNPNMNEHSLMASVIAATYYAKPDQNIFQFTPSQASKKSCYNKYITGTCRGQQIPIQTSIDNMSFEQIEHYLHTFQPYKHLPFIVFQVDKAFPQKHHTAIIYPNDFEMDKDQEGISIIRIVDYEQNHFHYVAVTTKPSTILYSGSKDYDYNNRKKLTKKQAEKKNIAKQVLQNGPQLIFPPEIASYLVPKGPKPIQQRTDISMNVRQSLIHLFGLDPAYYYSNPEYIYDVFLKMNHEKGTPIRVFKQGEEDYYHFIEAAWHGGYSQTNVHFCMTDHHTNVYYLDGNSMYPACCTKYKFPDLQYIQFVPNDQFDHALNTAYNCFNDVQTPQDDYGYLIEVEFTAPDDHSLIDDFPLTLHKVKQNGRIVTIAGGKHGKIITIPLHINLMIKYGYTVKPIRILKYSQSDIFHGLFTKLTQLRKNLNADDALTVKLISNALTGTFRKKDDTRISKSNKYNPLTVSTREDGSHVVMREKKDVKYPYQLYDFIMIYAKYEMWNKWYQLKESLTNCRLLFTKTDSLVFACDNSREEVDKLTGNEMGQFKLENKEEIIAFVSENANIGKYITANSTDDEIEEFENAYNNLFKKGFKNTKRDLKPFDENSDIIDTMARWDLICDQMLQSN